MSFSQHHLGFVFLSPYFFLPREKGATSSDVRDGEDENLISLRNVQQLLHIFSRGFLPAVRFAGEV